MGALEGRAAGSEGCGMKLYLTHHAVTRYHERVKPALLRRQAKVEFEALLAQAEKLGEPPAWLRSEHPDADDYIELADGIVAAVVGNKATTVLIRASGSPAHHRRKKEARQKRRRSVRGRGKHKGGPGSKGYERSDLDDEAA